MGKHQLKAALVDTHQAHHILEAARSESPLGNLESAALALAHITQHHRHIVE